MGPFSLRGQKYSKRCDLVAFKKNWKRSTLKQGLPHLWRMKSKARKRPSWLVEIPFKKLLPAVEKIGFTTLGILLALWVNNLDEGRKKREIEHKTLLEIRAGLEQDRLDLKETIQGYQFRVDNIQTIFSFLSRDSVPADSLSTAISSLNGYSYLLANTAAYETLKSRGLETITNDSLRLGIATLYDVHYEAIMVSEQHLDELFNNLLLPYLMTNLRLGGGRFSPNEIDKIRKDRPFQQILWQTRSMNQNSMERYQHAEASLQKLLNQIEAELNDGRF